MDPPRRSARVGRLPRPSYAVRPPDDDESQPEESNPPPQPSSDVDLFSAEEDVKPGTKKRATKDTNMAKKTRIPQKKKRARDEKGRALSPSPAQGIPSKSTLSPLRINPSKTTSFLNRWVNVRDTLKVTKPVPATNIQAQTLTPLGDMPNMPFRDFKFEIDSAVLDVNWDPREGDETKPLAKQDIRAAFAKYTRKIKTWRIFVWNSALPVEKRERYRLFPEIKPSVTCNRRTLAYRGGPLDVDICPTDADTQKVAAEACRLLNKFPGVIDKTDFPDVVDQYWNADSDMRKTIELLSLRALDPEFDFHKIRYVFRWKKRTSPGQYLLNSASNNELFKKNGCRYGFYIPMFTTNLKKTVDEPDHCSKTWPFAVLFDRHFTKERLEQLPDVPSWWRFEYLQPTNSKIYDKAKIPVEVMTRFFGYLAWEVFGHVGTIEAFGCAARDIGEGKPLRRFNSNKQGPFGGKALFSYDGHCLAVSSAVAETISGSVPYAMLKLPRAIVAVAMQRGYKTFVRTQDILETIQEFIVSIEELRQSGVSPNVHSYCECVDEDCRAQEAHHCMYCLDLVICATMARTQDDRLVCIAHFRDGPPKPETILQRRVQQAANRCEREFHETALSRKDRRDIGSALTTEEWITGDSYRDGYGGGQRVKGILHGHQHQMSLDAVFPLCMADNKYFLHHVTNVVLTALVLNFVKGDDLAIVLAAASEAVRNRKAGGNAQKMEQLELAFDHYYRIRTVIPWSKRQRFNAAKKQSRSWWRRFERLMRSGVYDGTPPIYNFHYMNSAGRKGEDKWGDKTIKRLNKICEEIEQSSLYNPKGLKLPRGPRHSEDTPGAPWLWNPKHMFEDHNWEYLRYIWTHRFHRLDEFCDWSNDHDQESAETLFLACVILWFKLDGGKDEILGLRMTVFGRHALRFSIGRATHVQPGSIMCTGWSGRHPKSLMEYDDSKRTITMETWIMNRGKHDFPVTPEDLAILEETLLEVQHDSPYWDNYPPTHTWEHINLPKTWKFMVMPMPNREEDTSDEDEYPDDTSSDDGNDDLRGDAGVIFEEEDNDELLDLKKDTRDDGNDDTRGDTGVVFEENDGELLGLEEDSFNINTGGTNVAAPDTTEEVSSWEARGAKFKAALDAQLSEEFSKWMAEAAPAMRLQESSTSLTHPSQRSNDDARDTAPADSDYGDLQDDEIQDAAAVFEGLRARFEEIEEEIISYHPYVIGDTTITAVMEDLGAAANRSDGEGFEKSYSSLMAAIRAIPTPGDSDV